MSVPIQPLGTYVVAQVEEAAKKTASGLYLPGGAQEKPMTAKIIAVSKEVKSVKVGDRIIYKTYANIDVKVGTEMYLLIKEEDVLATVK